MEILITIILILASCVITGVIVYKRLQPKLEASAKLDENILRENEELKKQREELYYGNNILE
jgi:hypothetical protein